MQKFIFVVNPNQLGSLSDGNDDGGDDGGDDGDDLSCCESKPAWQPRSLDSDAIWQRSSNLADCRELDLRFSPRIHVHIPSKEMFICLKCTDQC